MTDSLQKIDHSTMMASQVTIVLFNILAFVLDRPILAALVTAVMVLGTLFGQPGFGFVYRFALKPLGLLKPNVLDDNPEPHRFAQGFGAVVMLGGTVALYTGGSTLGWSLVWLVAGLAALNAFGGFCVGCFVYYWLARFNLPGFGKTPPEGTFPGMRPKGQVAE